MDNMIIEGYGCIFIKEKDGKFVYAWPVAGGYTLQATKTAIIIARCPRSSQQGNTNKGVYVVAEYLESLSM